jgi:hypothetical protein
MKRGGGTRNLSIAIDTSVFSLVTAFGSSDLAQPAKGKTSSRASSAAKIFFSSEAASLSG